jgi:hypothetical protein
MRSAEIKFDGAILERGFWLYLIVIGAPSGRVLYIGRTGDSSSANAASPFSRIGQHLDFRENAKGNALARNLRTAGIEPSSSSFRLIAVGPLFPEQSSFEKHKQPRDCLAALERDLASELRRRGHTVVGIHHSNAAAQPDLLASVLAELEVQVPELRAV